MSRRLQRLPVGMFGSEAELCDLFTTAARASGYRVFPAVSDWEVLLECRESGEQIGVHAKCRSTVEVLAQALAHAESSPGPNVHAVLVPFQTTPFALVALQCCVAVVQGVHLGNVGYDLRELFAHAPRWDHPTPEWCPEHEVLVPTRVPAPRRLTRWKIAAVQLCLIARERGYVTREDMKALELNPYWWVNKRYGQILTHRIIEVDGQLAVRRREYVLADPSNPLVPDLRWPEIVSAIEQSRERERVMAAVSSSAPPANDLSSAEREHEPPPHSQVVPRPPRTEGLRQRVKRLKPMIATQAEEPKGRACPAASSRRK